MKHMNSNVYIVSILLTSVLSNAMVLYCYWKWLFRIFYPLPELSFVVAIGIVIAASLGPIQHEVKFVNRPGEHDLLTYERWSTEMKSIIFFTTVLLLILIALFVFGVVTISVS